MARNVCRLLWLALLITVLGGCRTPDKGEATDDPQTLVTKEDRLNSKEWTEGEVIQFYWDHKESLEQIADLLYAVDKTFDFKLSGNDYICSQYGNEFNLSEYPNCQNVLDTLSGLDVVSVYYDYDESELPPKSLTICIRDDDMCIGLCYNSVVISDPFYKHIEGNWYHFRYGNT